MTPIPPTHTRRRQFVRLDVGFFEEPRIAALSSTGLALYLRLVLLSERTGQPGVVAPAQITAVHVTGRARALAELRAAGLVEASPVGLLMIHGWREWDDARRRRGRSAGNVHELRGRAG